MKYYLEIIDNRDIKLYEGSEAPNKNNSLNSKFIACTDTRKVVAYKEFYSSVELLSIDSPEDVLLFLEIHSEDFETDKSYFNRFLEMVKDYFNLKDDKPEDDEFSF